MSEHDEKPLMPDPAAPIGVILAGGVGVRIGGSKAIVELHGRPLISYPCEAMRRALSTVVVVAKADTELPSLPGATVWVEPQSVSHPLIGLRHALAVAEGRPVVVCPVDLPFVTAEVIRELAQADPGPAPAIVAAAEGRVQPLLGCYQPACAEPLAARGREPDVPVREAVAALGAALLEVDPLTLFNVNSPDDLLQAAAMLDRMPAPTRM
ncbi:MAG: molybdenum cofactor guanylyltransferase [Solirubrobacterales bacterium]|nr:molybdenum cofactor guanylyltransferase [Solirubrobacterales bacterium]